MNLEEAINLLAVVLAFNFEASERRPNVSILDDQKEGFVIYVKNNFVTDEYRRYLEGIVESRNLWLRESEGYLMIKG